jgi:rhodanese-related sulfurtransferase
MRGALKIEKKNTTIFGALAVIVMVICFFPTKAPPVEKASTSDPPPSLASTVKKRNPSYAISTEAVLHKLKEKQSITLVDVRSNDQFDEVSIPGSINIPLYAVKTKTYLKSTPVILINEGYSYEPLERECARLRKAGFQVWILNGGLYYWKQRGGPLHGDHFIKGELNKVPAPIFFTEKAYEEWLIIDVSSSKNVQTSSLLPEAIPVPYSNNAAEFTARLHKAIAPLKINPLRSLIFFNETGEKYDAIEKVIHKAGYTEVFFLKGGLAAYDTFVSNLTQIKQARENSKRTIKRCINCP